MVQLATGASSRATAGLNRQVCIYVAQVVNLQVAAVVHVTPGLSAEGLVALDVTMATSPMRMGAFARHARLVRPEYAECAYRVKQAKRPVMRGQRAMIAQLGTCLSAFGAHPAALVRSQGIT